MNRKLMPALFGAIALIGAAFSPAGAQSAAFEGTYVYSAQQSDDIAAAIEQGVRKMNFITRPIARGRLKKTNPVYETISISHTDSDVSVQTDSREPIVTPANGTPIEWEREDGEMFDVSTEWENGKLEQTFQAEDGQRINVYSLSPDGETLTLNVTVTSPRLAAPVVYNLVYNRQS